MKKVILSAVAVAAAFMAFAFTPVTTNSAISNTITNAVEVPAGKCETKYQTDVTFDKCNSSWTESATFQDQSSVLEKY